jgi:2-keto-4-pentenoate hydratase/2-oxohepta-3-ene-1,7-dioic acid hydratase in catechol pathway
MLFHRTEKTVNLFGTEIPEPRLFLDFLGFETHVRQIREKRGTNIWPGWYDHATYYIADLSPEKTFGPGEEVTIPNFVKAPDYEFEIACIVGKAGQPKTEEEALKFFKEQCYLTIINDWSARDVQKRDMEGLGPANSKSIIGNSIGPKIVPVSQFKMDEHGVFDMELILTVNGEQRSKTNYNSIYHTHPATGKKQAWSFPRIISWLGQQNIAVLPGYIIGSGTVGNGCIGEFAAKMDAKTNEVLEPAIYPWLKDGDLIRFEAQGLGVLESKVKVAAEASTKEYVSVK